MKLTGAKLDQKLYYRHSGEPGRLQTTSYEQLLERKPELPIEKAVRGMLPKNVLGRELLTQAQGLRGARITRTRRRSPAPRYQL